MVDQVALSVHLNRPYKKLFGFQLLTRGRSKMMRKIFIIAVSISLFIWVGSAWAVSITYTADNVANTWYVQGETGSAQNLSAGDNRDTWQVADTEVLDLEPDSDFTFVWH